MAEAFKILAEHFSGKEGLRIEIKGDIAKSSPEEKLITLPENIPQSMFGVTLATLLHESGIIKNSGLITTQFDKSSNPIVAVLEGIKADALAFGKYPNAPSLYGELIEYLNDKIDTTGFNRGLKILKDIVLESYGNEEIFSKLRDNSPEVRDFMATNSAYIKTFLTKVKAVRKYAEMVALANELFEKLFEKEFKEQAQKQEAKNDSLDQPNEELEEATKELREKIKEVSELNEAYKKNYSKRCDDANGGKLGPMGDILKAEGSEILDAMNVKKEEYRQVQETHAKIDRKVRNLRGELAQEQRAFKNELAKKITFINDLLPSFDNLDKKDFAYNNQLSFTIEQELLNFLKNLQERQTFLDDGKISPGKLPTYFDGSNLFEQKPQDKLDKTRIYFIVDKSGSMDDGNRYRCACEALNKICQVLEKGIETGYDLEYAIYGFNNKAQLIKNFEEKYSNAEVAHCLKPFGSTYPVDTIATIESLWPDNPRTKEFVFFLTDGGFDNDTDYDYVKTRLNGRKKWIFIGIGIDTREAKPKELFGEYNITDSKDIEKVLVRAMENSL